MDLRLVMEDKLLHDAVKKISENYHQILDDWCKAYMAELYEKGFHLRPGMFVLNQRQIFKDGHIVSQAWCELLTGEFRSKDYDE